MRCAVPILALALGIGTAGTEGQVTASGSTTPRSLTLEDRIAAQRAIEEVAWRHRIWPKENPGPKPPLSSVRSDASIRAQVEDYLKQTNALETIWHQPITAQQLQAELDRMVTGSRDPSVLRELFGALGNDPFVAAETLARSTLAARLIRNRYAFDERFHGELKHRAQLALAECGEVPCMGRLGGDYRETNWTDAVERNDELSRLSSLLDAPSDALPTHKLGALDETADGFEVTAVLEQSDGTLTTATTTWHKTSFDAWWASQAGTFGTTVPTSASDYVIAPTAAAACTNDSWTPTRYGAPSPRNQHTAVWTGTEMIVWGGFTHTGDMNSGGRYTPATDSWQPTSSGANVPSPRRLHTAVWTGREMIIWGQGPGGRYDPSTDTWAAMPPEPGVVTRSLHTAVWTGTEMIVWGGQPLTNIGSRYNPVTNSWLSTSRGANVPATRNRHSAVWTGTEMIVWGGFNGSYLNSGGRYNPATDTWAPTSIGADVPSVRSSHTALWTGTEMIVWGGTSSSAGTMNSGGRYDPTADSWTATSTSTGRRDHEAVWTGTTMIVWGGFASDGGSTHGSRYDPHTNLWSDTSTAVIRGQPQTSAVWTGTEMIVWGGGSGGGGTSDGGRYDPATDIWTVTGTAGVPSQRYLHSAAWTGNEMVIWGGFTVGVGYLNSGGRYVPATDSWTPTSTGPNVPSERGGATAVWTGEELIFWGGQIGGRPAVGSGGRYDPASNAWAAIATGGNAPSARQGHTAVWTGTEMIVWGGSAELRVNTGGRYVPSSNSWTPTSTSGNVPTARTGHSAVWTGSKMIVWGGGGATSDTFTRTGGQYDPSSDAWTPTSTGANVPSGRADHTAVWTGSEMIVWGGEDSVSRLGDGSRYDPSTDSWVGVPATLNSPGSRSEHFAFWTGLDMIVWGGQGPGGSTNTGGRYEPATGTWGATSIGANVPEARESGSAVWTGSEMIIWGGYLTSTGARYCGCPSGLTSYLDGDGDGYGDPVHSTFTCDGTIPPGYAAEGTDCNDGNAAVSPGASESCNAIDDDCDGTTDEDGGALCDDGNACTVGDTCSAGACVGGVPVVCKAIDVCHAVGVCDPSSGVCSEPTQPEGTLCDDNDLCTIGDSCRNGTCTPASSGLDEPNPRTNGYYKRLCHGPHSGDQLSDADATCASQVTATFAGISTVAEICAVLEPSQPNNDACGRTDDDLLVLALNVCRGRVCTIQAIDSECGGNTDVGQSLAESDVILSGPSRNAGTCAHAKCLTEEINSGGALELNSLTLSREGNGVRLNWNPPYLEDGTAEPSGYRVWRRTSGSLSPFAEIGETSVPIFVDATADGVAFEYEVTAVMH